MFFHQNNFDNVLPEDQAALIAKIANKVLDDSAHVLFGEFFKDGRAANFTTEQKPTDTHVCLAVGMQTMGKLKPSGSPIAIEKPTDADMVKAQDARLKLLENENRQLRSMKNV